MRARTEENLTVIDKLVLNHGDQPQFDYSARPTAQSAILWIIFHHVLEDLTKVIYARLSSAAQNSTGGIIFIWFANKNLFTLASLKNSQNARLYASAAATKKTEMTQQSLLHARTTLSQSLMVTVVGVLKLSYTGLIFVGPEVKIS